MGNSGLYRNLEEDIREDEVKRIKCMELGIVGTCVKFQLYMWPVIIQCVIFLCFFNLLDEAAAIAGMRIPWHVSFSHVIKIRPLGLIYVVNRNGMRIPSHVSFL